VHFGCGIDAALLSSGHHTFSAEIYTVLLGVYVWMCGCAHALKGERVWVCACV